MNVGVTQFDKHSTTRAGDLLREGHRGRWQSSWLDHPIFPNCSQFWSNALVANINTPVTNIWSTWGQMLEWTGLQESCLLLWLYTDAQVLAPLGICSLTTLFLPCFLLSTPGLAPLLPSFDVFDILWLLVYQLSSWGWGGIFNILKSFQLLACRPGLKTKTSLMSHMEQGH